MLCRHCDIKATRSIKFCQKFKKEFLVQFDFFQKEKSSIFKIQKQDTSKINEILNSEIIFKRDCGRSPIVSFIWIIIFSFLLLTIDIVFLAANPDKINGVSSDKADQFRMFVVIAIIKNVIIIVLTLVRAINTYRTFICVTDNGIYGRATSSNLFSTALFIFEYTNITYVTAEENYGLLVESGGEQYRCFVKGNDLLAGKINSLCRRKSNLFYNNSLNEL